ncbi:hypothetical protein POTOM_039160 [Populus tomentosa]|uniref:Uncharacterized protein n=1 Tax=Populus tomentosa TaxID=118781 RepID=A0A8X7Z2R9_POPTO|nr:hypothetical protein POTOM_039160 [Populus tomentosa]
MERIEAESSPNKGSPSSSLDAGDLERLGGEDRKGNSKDGSADHGCGGPYHISRKEPPSEADMEAKKNGKEPRMHHSNYFSHTMCCQQNRLNGKGLINNKALLYQGCGGVHNPANGLALKNASLTSQRRQKKGRQWIGKRVKEPFLHEEIASEECEQKPDTYIIFTDLLKSCVSKETNDQDKKMPAAASGCKKSHQSLEESTEIARRTDGDRTSSSLNSNVSKPLLKLSKAKSSSGVSLELTLA